MYEYKNVLQQQMPFKQNNKYISGLLHMMDMLFKFLMLYEQCLAYCSQKVHYRMDYGLANCTFCVQQLWIKSRIQATI